MKEYLGDCVYAEFENGRIKLTTNNGYWDTSIIFLEDDIYLALTHFVQRNTLKKETI